MFDLQRRCNLVEERGLFANVGEWLAPLGHHGRSWERERESVALIRGVVGGFDFLEEFGILEKSKNPMA